MNSFTSLRPVSTNISENSVSSAAAGFYGPICLEMKDFRSLDECLNAKTSLIDTSSLLGFKLFLYQMQLLLVKNLTIRYYKDFSPKDFNNLDNQNILGAQYLSEIDYAMDATVYSYERSEIVKFSTPFQFGSLCFYVRRPEIQKTTETSK